MSDAQSRQYILDTLASLPAKRRNKNLVGNLKRFSEIAARSRDLLAISIASGERAKLVFSDIQLSTATERVSNARKKAKACLRDLSQNIDAVAKSGFETRLIDMKDYAGTAMRPINEAWQKKVQDIVRPYEILVTIVAERKLKGSGTLVKTLDGIKTQQNEVPATKAAALDTKQRISGLPEIVSSLGLTGKVGEFLIAASRGSGSPRDLENQEIRDFLDRYGLWISLQVSFGAATK